MSRAGIPEAYVVDLSLRGRVIKWIKSHPVTFSVGAATTAGVVAVVWFIVWMATPREVVVKVEDISWHHLTHLREREVRHGSGWGYPGEKGFYKEPVFNQRCDRRYYGQESCNPHSCHHRIEYYSCNCTSNRGCQTCSRHVSDTCWDSCPVYRTWCDYDYFEWPVVKSESRMGSTHEVSWGEFEPGPLQRVQKIANYEVNFIMEDDRFQYRPTMLSDFRRFFPNDRWQLQVGRIRRHNIEKMTKL